MSVVAGIPFVQGILRGGGIGGRSTLSFSFSSLFLSEIELRDKSKMQAGPTKVCSRLKKDSKVQLL